MAKAIMLKLGDEPSAFAFTRLDRAKLYGYKERQVVDADGGRCSPAYLSADGAALVPGGGLAMLYVDEQFATLDRATLKAVDAGGEALPLQASTLGVEQTLNGPLPPQAVLDHVIASVYQLEAESLGPTLAAALADGQIFSAPFSYRGDYQLQTLFLLQGEGGVFALIGSPTGFAFIQRDEAPLEESEDEDLSDDLDFSMM